MCIHKKSESLLSLIQLISPVFPIGGFSYSRGLEWAIERGWVNSIESFFAWQKQWIDGPLLYLEWPMMKRCYYCLEINDAVQFLQCATSIVSYRDTYETRLEEQQRGQAITKLILQWYCPVNDHWLLGLKLSGLASIVWLGYMWKISIEDLSLGYAYSMSESSVIVGLKLIPFGQKSAQKLLRYFQDLLIDAWNKCIMFKDCELGNSFLMQSIASSCHETQYSRLFRS